MGRGTRDEILDLSGGAAGPASLDALDPALVAALVEDAPDGIVVVDGTGRIVLANRRVEDLFGYAGGELVGQPVEVLVPPGARAAHATHRSRYDAAPGARPMGAGLELAGRRRDGTDIPVEISLSPVTTGSGRFTIAIVRDVTDRVRAEEALRQAREELALVEDQERIARDLHDTVVQRIFATGLTLQAAALRMRDQDARHRIEGAITELDTAVREIRMAIFGLHSTSDGGGLRQSVMAVAAEAARTLGFHPAVRFDGPVDSAVPEQAADGLLSVLREALSNVARHARATRVDVEVGVDERTVTLQVVDDGCGVPTTVPLTGGRGLANMEARARSLGGRCERGSPAGGGTTVRWEVPLGST